MCVPYTPRWRSVGFTWEIKQHYRRRAATAMPIPRVLYVSFADHRDGSGRSTAAEIIDRCQRPTRARPCSVCVSVAPVAGPQLSDVGHVCRLYRGPLAIAHRTLSADVASARAANARFSTTDGKKTLPIHIKCKPFDLVEYAKYFLPQRISSESHIEHIFLLTRTMQSKRVRTSDGTRNSIDVLGYPKLSFMIRIDSRKKYVFKNHNR